MIWILAGVALLFAILWVTQKLGNMALLAYIGDKTTFPTDEELGKYTRFVVLRLLGQKPKL